MTFVNGCSSSWSISSSGILSTNERSSKNFFERYEYLSMYLKQTYSSFYRDMYTSLHDSPVLTSLVDCSLGRGGYHAYPNRSHGEPLLTLPGPGGQGSEEEIPKTSSREVSETPTDVKREAHTGSNVEHEYRDGHRGDGTGTRRERSSSLERRY